MRVWEGLSLLPDNACHWPSTSYRVYSTFSSLVSIFVSFVALTGVSIWMQNFIVPSFLAFTLHNLHTLSLWFVFLGPRVVGVLHSRRACCIIVLVVGASGCKFHTL